MKKKPETGAKAKVTSINIKINSDIRGIIWDITKNEKLNI